MNGPLCSLWGGGLGGVRQKHVTRSLKKKKGSGEKSLLASLAAALNRAQMSLRADLTLCHTCRQCLHKADSERVCWWTYIINYCMIIHYRQ